MADLNVEAISMEDEQELAPLSLKEKF